MCFMWISEHAAIISLCHINWLVFITETECVYCAVRTESLSKLMSMFVIKRVSVRHKFCTHTKQCFKLRFYMTTRLFTPIEDLIHPPSVDVITIYHHNHHRRHYLVYFLFYGATASNGPGPPHWGLPITLKTHNTRQHFSGRGEQRDAKTSSWQHRTLKIPASERPQTQALDRAATAISISPYFSF